MGKSTKPGAVKYFNDIKEQGYKTDQKNFEDLGL